MYVVTGKQDLTSKTRVLQNTSAASAEQPDMTLTPKVCTVEKTTDHLGVTDSFLGLDVYCQVSIFNYLRDIQNLDPNVVPSTIDVMFSNHNLSFYESKAKKTANQALTEGLMKKYELLSAGTAGYDPRQENQTASDFKAASLNSTPDLTTEFSVANKQGLYSDATKVGAINLSELSDINTVVTHKKLKIIKTNDGRLQKQNEQKKKEEILNIDSFKKLYNAMITENNDPALLFQDSFMKTSFKDKKSGILNISNKKSKKYQDAFSPIFNSLKRQIQVLEKSQYSFELTNEEQDLKVLKTRVHIGLNKLQAFNNRFYVILLLKNKNGINLDAQSYLVDRNSIEKQLLTNGTDYEIKAARLNNNVSLLSLGSKNSKKNINLNLYAKTVSRIKPFSFCYYKDLGEVIIPPKKVVQIKDGTKTAHKTRYPVRFKSSDNIFYRSTLNYQNKEYHNGRVATDKSKVKNEMVPHIAITAEQFRESIQISVRYISDNIVAIRPRKYVLKGDTQAKSDLKFIIGAEGEILKFTDTSDLKHLNYVDLDVYRTTAYMYVVECIMKNGEKKIAPVNFIEKREEPSNSVVITDINILTGTTDRGFYSVTPYELENEPLRQVRFSFTLKKNKNEIEKLLEQMFGNMFELFKEELQQINDTQGVVYSVEVVRINHFTGESATIAKLTPDENGLCNFADNFAPLLPDVTYKLIPRMSPALDMIKIINEKVNLLATKNIHKSGRGTMGAMVRSRENARLNILSRPGTKLAKREAFLKGLIVTPEYDSQKSNFDFFHDSSTGDLRYVKIPGVGIYDNAQKIKVSQGSVERINLLYGLSEYVSNRTQKYHATRNFDKENFVKNEIKKRDVKFCNVSFQVNNADYYVDFYAFFVKENNSVYLDGFVHSNDEYSQNNYNYLVKHRGSFGIVSYYVVPFYKNGTYSEPLLVTGQIIN